MARRVRWIAGVEQETETTVEVGNTRRGVTGPLVLFGVGVAVAAVGIALSIGRDLAGVSSMVPKVRTAVLGSVTIDVQSRGTVCLFAESRSEIGGNVVTGPVPIPGLVLTARDARGDGLRGGRPPVVSSRCSMPEYEGD